MMCGFLSSMNVVSCTPCVVKNDWMHVLRVASVSMIMDGWSQEGVNVGVVCLFNDVRG